MINKKQIKRSAVAVFETKAEMLKYVKEFAFEQLDRLVIHRVKTKWIVYLSNEKELEKLEKMKSKLERWLDLLQADGCNSKSIVMNDIQYLLKELKESENT